MRWTRYFDDRHGGLRAWLTNLRLRVLDRFDGRYAPLRDIDFGRVERVVFCCWGNVCRSAYADARLRELGLRTDSFGLRTTPGKPAHPPAVAAAARRNLDLGPHRTRELAQLTLTATDLVLAMEPEQLALLPSMPAQVSLLGLWHPRQSRPLLQDPYNRSDAYFDACFDYIDASIATLQTRLAATASRS